MKTKEKTKQQYIDELGKGTTITMRFPITQGE